MAVSLALVLAVPAQVDSARIQKQQEDAKKRGDAAQAQAKAKIAEVKKLVPETDSKVVRCLEDADIKLIGPGRGGKTDDVEIPCRRLKVIGMRAGPVAFVAH